jgi:hypothetical protein
MEIVDIWNVFPSPSGLDAIGRQPLVVDPVDQDDRAHASASRWDGVSRGPH